MQPCCVGVVRDVAALRGSLSTFDLIEDIHDADDLELYTTIPEHDWKPKSAVIVIHDVFGFKIPNCKYVVDFLAKSGFYAVMPDLYHGDGLDPDAGRDEKTMAWIGTKTSPEFWAKVQREVLAVVKYLKEDRGILKVGAIGFCWGGKGAVLAGASGELDAVVSLHGSFHKIEDVTNSEAPVYFITPEGDDYFPKEIVPELTDLFERGHAEGGIQVVKGVAHGFAVRGDYSVAEVKEKADKALRDTAVFLHQHLDAQQEE